MLLKQSFLLIVTLLFIACGTSTNTIVENSTIKVTLTKSSNDISSKSHTDNIEVKKQLNSKIAIKTLTSSKSNNKTGVILSGSITFDFIPFTEGGRDGLDYNNIVKKSMRGVVVEIVNTQGVTIARTSTNQYGEYSVSVSEQNVKVRVLAQLYKAPLSGKSSWSFQVKDNTNSNALYAIEGAMASVGENTIQIRNLHASSGWEGNAYTSNRAAAPFAILDVVYEAIQKVTEAQSTALFGSLDIFWSKNNIAVAGNKSLGQIITSHFDGTALYILGKEDSDTDEYDSAVVGHEWGHYYEALFSRSDSIGGAHSDRDMLDIRVAFGEGFGTALGCIIIDSPLYLDSSGVAQGSTGVFSDLENSAVTSSSGWYNEASIYRIIYDIYDSNDDEGDTLSLGFSPIHNALIKAQKETTVFTSIFSFIKAIKDENPGNDEALDALTSGQDIAPIVDIYGTGRTNRKVNANPLYSRLEVGGSVGIVTDYTAKATSSDNMLGRYNFVIFSIEDEGTYSIDLSQVQENGTFDPDMSLYKEGSSTAIAKLTNDGSSDSIKIKLTAGVYRMAIIVYN